VLPRSCLRVTTESAVPRKPSFGGGSLAENLQNEPKASRLHAKLRNEPKARASRDYYESD
jgi:hypothetical protein